MIASLRQEAQAVVEASSIDEDKSMSDQFDGEIGNQPSQRPTSRRAGKLSAFAALVAAALIVALMALALHTLAPASRVGTHAKGTPTVAAHVTHARGHWSDVARYTLNGSSSIFISPSNPNVVYEAVVPLTNATTYTLRRSDDGGATWVSLPNPTIDDPAWFGQLFASPLDAQVVFLTLGSNQTNAQCPKPSGQPGAYARPDDGGAAQAYRGLAPLSGGYSCSFQYVSRDGGLHWSQPDFPLPGQHFTGGFRLTDAAQAQGNRLYATITGDLNGVAYFGSRLVASDDGGMTWSAADSDIQAQGATVVSYRAIPGGTTLFATTMPQGTETNNMSPPLLWRSDDGGAHWSRVGALPHAQTQLIGAGTGPQGMLLYAAILDGSARMPGILASADGGATWRAAPSAGFPATPTTTTVGSSPAPTPIPILVPAAGVAAVGMLADGSLVVEYSPPWNLQNQPGGEILMNYDVAYFGWRPGDSSWFQVTPQPGKGVINEAWIDAPADQPQAIWIVFVTADNTTFTVRKCVLG
jgi:hypothetical protein